MTVALTTCRCQDAGIGWWDLVTRINANLVICKLCDRQWQRFPDFGWSRWTWSPPHVIQEHL